MKIDEEGMALLNQYAEDFALARGDAAREGRTFDQSIHDAQIDLVLHLIAIFEVGVEDTDRTRSQ